MNAEVSCVGGTSAAYLRGVQCSPQLPYVLAKVNVQYFPPLCLLAIFIQATVSILSPFTKGLIIFQGY